MDVEIGLVKNCLTLLTQMSGYANYRVKSSLCAKIYNDCFGRERTTMGHSMSRWLDCIQNPEAITSLYDVPPELRNICLSRINLQDSGWACQVVLVTSELPTRRPQRWGDCNVVHIELGMVEITELEIVGWPWERFGSATAVRSESNVVFEATGASFRVKVGSTAGIFLCSVRGVLVENEWLSKFQSDERSAR